MNSKQRLLFSITMTTIMASVMSWLGMAKSTGINLAFWRAYATSILPTLAFAIMWNVLVASNVAKLMIKLGTRKLTDEAEIITRSGTIRSWTMISVMCFTMSTLALVVNGELFAMTPVTFILAFFGDFTMAFFVRGMFVMPLVKRMVLGTPKTVQIISEEEAEENVEAAAE
ncbi:hypothetical protein FD13_GL000135 [Levilactobacillus senmaizukei DSM 21775 = NBRC 103853]|uniref:DUF2798 domain-containing protein n=1 Tax=Levilactobacillus senmaizukei DSM 21775 = NBRC 103853 TaxID=1423803 RepID=A0A0R2DGZ6_9LACO|nr:hypothetical protein [Levilactobacillus senmaizukei]KRN03352.1 hypothetical protein FD13_GL000135 [Levilactobacillus senmaizukei DSM 21775 = NBRC 103853]